MIRHSRLRVLSPFLAWGDFHARSRFARSTIPEEKWGTTRSLPPFHVLIVFNFQLAFFLEWHNCNAGAFDGPGGKIAHASYPEISSPSFIHFDGDEQWTVSDGTSNKYSLLPVALHEVGHVLGLKHSSNTTAVMYEKYNKDKRSIQLDDDDVAGIQQKYGGFNCL